VRPGSSSWEVACTATAHDATGHYSCPWNTRSYPDGTYRLRARFRDLASDSEQFTPTATTDDDGNVGYSAEATTLVDNTPPDVREIAPAVGSDVSDAILDSPAEVMLRQTDAGSGIDRSDLEYNTATDGSANGGWTPASAAPVTDSPDSGTDWDTTEVPDGLHRMRARTYDRAGNVRTSEWQVAVANPARHCRSSGGVPGHCYAGWGILGQRIPLGSRHSTYGGAGVRANMALPSSFPGSTRPGWSVAFIDLSGARNNRRNLEFGGVNRGDNDACGPAGAGWFIFGVWTPTRGPQRSECTMDRNGRPISANPMRQYVVTLAGDARVRAYYELGGRLRLARIEARSSYWTGRRGFSLGAFGETNTQGRQLAGSWAAIRYNPNPPGGGWGIPSQWLANRSGAGYGHKTYPGRNDYMCVHGPNRGCSPPQP
jgi:hypothetical protein